MTEDQAVQILSNEGAQCGNCGDQPGDRNCPDCEKCRRGYVAALIAAGWGPRAELEEDLAKLRDLLRVENKRANDAIGREETAEQAALEARQDRPAVLREAANGLAALGPLDSLVSAPAAWTEAIETLRRMADQIAEDELRPKAAAALSADCNCDPAPLDLGDGTYSHWAGCPIADAQQAADEAQQAGVHLTDTFAAASCPYGKGPGDGSGCIKPAGHDGDHLVTAGVPVMPCSRAVLQQPHLPHSWWPQPGMAYVHCPGATTETQQTGEGR